jgi:phosphocarrier protein HPr
MMGQKTNSVKKDFKIQNKLGLHARPVAMFVKCANRFVSDIVVEKNNETVNGKSIMGMMMLAAGKDSVITITATGPDAQEAIAEFERLLNSKFGEE